MATDSIHLVRRLHQHRTWANENLLDAAANLTDDQLRQQFPIGQGSIWQSLVHMYAAEYVWLESLLGNDQALTPGDLPGRIPGNQLGDGRMASFAELRDNWSALRERWDRYLHDLSPESLDEQVSRTTSTGQRMATKRSDVLLHVCTHAHYTAAQIVNMLRHVGVEKLPATMLIALARHESSNPQ